MKRERAAFLVMVDLDPIAGWGDNPGDWQRHLEAYLLNSVGHYNPVVVEFTPNDLEPMKRAEREAGAAEVRARVERVADDLHDEAESRANRHLPHIAGEVSGLQMAEHRLRVALNGGES